MISHTACSAVYDDTDNTDYVKLVMAQSYAKGVTYPRETGKRNASAELLRAVGQKGGLVLSKRIIELSKRIALRLSHSLAVVEARATYHPAFSFK